jgi:hypothetical protein
MPIYGILPATLDHKPRINSIVKFCGELFYQKRRE